MRKTISATLASLVLATSGLANTAYADWDGHRRQDNYIQNYCSNHWRDPDCHDWQDNRHSWNERHYHNWYRRHHDAVGPEDAAAALFGFVAGAAANVITGGAGVSHRDACEAHYRSYDWRSDSYLGYDGDRHPCRF